MSEKHTPGPWKHGGGLYVTSNGVPDRFVRASSGIVAYCEGSIDKARANARLIAAAPDLLEACKLVVYRYERRADGDVIGPEDYAALCDAIAKATAE